MKKKIFLSAPMGERSKEEIETEFNLMKETLKSAFGDGYEMEFITNYISDEELAKLDGTEVNKIAHCLAEAARKMSKCDCVVFHPNWPSSGGCRIEMDICKRAQIQTMIIDDGFSRIIIGVDRGMIDDIFNSENIDILEDLTEISSEDESFSNGECTRESIINITEDMPQYAVDRIFNMARSANTEFIDWIIEKVKLIRNMEG